MRLPQRLKIDILMVSPRRHEKEGRSERSDITLMKAHCNECLKVTNQTVLFQKDFKEESALGDRFTIDRYQTLQCNGCEHVTFRLVEIRDNYTNEDGSPYENEVYYPPEKSRHEPDWLNQLAT